MKLNRNFKYLAIGLFVLALLSAYIYFTQANGSLQDKYLTVPVQRGAIQRTVSATGTLQAVITVQVGSQVSGRVQHLYADFNSVVKKGQTLAIIDPSNFEAQLERASANLATSEATKSMAAANQISRQAELASARANLEIVQVTLEEAHRQLERDRDLFEERLISERELESTQAAFDQGRARIQQAKAQIQQVEASIRSAVAQLEQAVANIRQAQAELRMAEVNLQYTKITSPIDGVVIERNVDIGQTVAASFQAPVLFLIANDLSKMQVIAQIDEADIGAISEEANVDFNVDAFPGEIFRGNISEIRLSSKLPATASGSTASGGATNVVVYNIMIDVNNPRLKLRPNMTANVNFTVARVQDVLKIPNSALRYRPSGKSQAEIAQLLSEPNPGQSAESPGDPSVWPADRPAAVSPSETGKAVERRPPDSLPSRHGNGLGSYTGSTTQRSVIEQYGVQAGPKIHFPQAEAAEPSWEAVWILDHDGVQPRRVHLGINDGRETAVLDGELEEGDLLITWEMDDEGEFQGTASPFGGAFGPRRTRSAGKGKGSR